MKSNKLVESWKDALVLIILAILVLGIAYAIVFCRPDSYLTTGSGKAVEGIIREMVSSIVR